MQGIAHPVRGLSAAPVHSLALVAAAGYLLRDTFAAPLRYALDIAGAGPAWFAVDALGLAALAVFAWHYALRLRRPMAIYAMLLLATSLAIAAATVGPEPAFLAAALKMILPLYAGWLAAGMKLAGTASPRERTGRAVLVAACLATIAGIAVDHAIDFPWAGMTVDQFGVAKTVGKVWTIRSTERIGGFAGESTAAAAIALFAWLLAHRSLRPGASVALGIAVAAACALTTSRTALAVAVLAVVYVALESYLIAPLRDRAAHRVVALASFAMVVVPLALVALAATLRFDAISPDLASLQQRIETSWSAPFVLLADRSPGSFIGGCGLGCMTFPMRYSGWAELLRPVDNFHLVSFAMFGLGYLPLLGGMIVAATREVDRTRLLLLAALNLYTLTLEGWSPSFTLFAMGYASGGMMLVRFGSPARDGAVGPFEASSTQISWRGA